mmetsp:Transcript_18846/g.39909  ORF Transcript_18846/g.39909 Transcript_18846/m.39909 type:complete len:229 (+) Transcript_18846:178-864(+)
MLEIAAGLRTAENLEGRRGAGDRVGDDCLRFRRVEEAGGLREPLRLLEDALDEVERLRRRAFDLGFSFARERSLEVEARAVRRFDLEASTSEPEPLADLRFFRAESCLLGSLARGEALLGFAAARRFLARDDSPALPESLGEGLPAPLRRFDRSGERALLAGLSSARLASRASLEARSALAESAPGGDGSRSLKPVLLPPPLLRDGAEACGGTGAGDAGGGGCGGCGG